MDNRQDVNEVRYAVNRLRDRISLEFRDSNTEDPAAYLEMRDLQWAVRSMLYAANDWEVRWRKANRHPLTNWDLQGAENRKWLERQNLSHPTKCGTCGWTMTTEAAIAKHYVIPDINLPNTGYCWTKLAPEYAGSRPEWPAA